MSNPEPDNMRRERRRHIGPIVGITLVLLFALGLFLWWMVGTAMQAPGPGEGLGMDQEERMAPPASPDEGGAVAPVEGDADATGAPTDAVGDPSPSDEPADAP